MAKMPDPLRLQHNVKNNASEIQNFISDLNSWEDGIKTKDKKLLKVLRAPFRARHLLLWQQHHRNSRCQMGSGPNIVS